MKEASQTAVVSGMELMLCPGCCTTMAYSVHLQEYEFDSS